MDDREIRKVRSCAEYERRMADEALLGVDRLRRKAAKLTDQAAEAAEAVTAAEAEAAEAETRATEAEALAEPYGGPLETPAAVVVARAQTANAVGKAR